MSEAPAQGPPDPEPEARIGLFRKEAVEARTRGRSPLGTVFSLSPRWLAASYWVLVAALVCLGVVGVFGRAEEFVSGPALVMARGRAELTAPGAGAVVEVPVRQGEPLEAGQPVVRLAAGEEEAEHQRREAEFEALLVRALLRPEDPALHQAVASARRSLQAATAALEGRVVRAPRAGVLGEVRVRSGQAVQGGEVVGTLVVPGEGFELVALLPGAARPRLRAGLPLRLELEGYPTSAEALVVRSLSERVVTADEAKRLWGAGSGGVPTLEGPVVVLEADFSGATFASEGRRYGLHDGMVGRVRVAVGKVPMAYLVVPWLRRAFEGG